MLPTTSSQPTSSSPTKLPTTAPSSSPAKTPAPSFTAGAIIGAAIAGALALVVLAGFVVLRRRRTPSHSKTNVPVAVWVGPDPDVVDAIPVARELNVGQILFDFHKGNDRQIEVRAGDVVTIIKTFDDGKPWLHSTLN